MRRLFNHGLSASELFSGDTMQACDKNKRWFYENFGFDCLSVDVYLGHVFTYAMDIIVTHVIEHKVRFMGPFNMFYIDFEMFMDDEFITHRRRGRMREIDIVESDFTGYQLTYFYRYSKNDSRYKKLNLYIGEKHKSKFLEKINSGEKMYTIEDVQLEYFIPLVHKKFNRLSKSEVRKILYKGFYRMYYAIKQQCYIALKSDKIGCVFFIGTYYKNWERQFAEYSFRMRKKLIKIDKWKETKFDQYYYIAIDKKKMPDWVKLNDKNDVAGWIWLTFKDVIARKQLKAALYTSTYCYIFKIKVVKKYCHLWNIKIDEKKIRDPEFVGISVNYKLQPATMHWKELIKTYEKGDS